MHSDNHKNKKGYLKRRILIPLAVIITITVAVFSAATVWHVRTAIDREAENQVDFAGQTYRKDIEGDARQMAALLEILTQDTAIRQAFEQQDREALLRLARPYYQRLNSDLHITHFYFTRPDRLNLLRVHAPSRHSDRIDRFTTLEAESSGQPAYGLELGVLGTFTLRVVKPWFHQGELLGYVELGEEIEHIVDAVRKTLGIGLFILIDKEQLDREEWERGMQLLGRESEWERYPHHILVSAPQRSAAIPVELEKRLKESQTLPLDRPLDVSLPEERYKAVFTPLRDVRSEKVGMMLLMSPTEHWFKHGRNTIVGATLLFLLLGGGVFILFYRLAEKTERQLHRAGERLLQEARSGERLQDEHIDMLQQQNALLEEAKTELQLNRHRLEEAQRLAHIGSWEWTLEGNTLHWSDEVYRIFGYQPGEFEATYAGFLRHIPPANRRKVEQAVRDTLDNGSTYELEHPIIRADGSERHVREVGEVTYDEQHRPLRMHGTVHDITNRIVAEQRNRQLGHIFDNTSNEIYLIEASGLNIIEANHTAQRQLDYAADEMRQLNYLEIAADITRERFTELARPLSHEQHREIRFEAIHQRKNAESYPVEVRLQRSDMDNRDIYVVMVLDISERLEQEMAIQHQAMYDKLTDLPNRYMLAEQLQREVARAQRKQYSLTLIQLNLSGFGEINDTLGHDKGDALLKQLSKRLKGMVRQSDFVARTGGDEFVIMLPESGMNEVDTVLEHLQQTLSHPIRIDAYSLNIEAATGVAIFPDHADSAKELLQHTDVALKRAKSFRSVSEIYRPDFDPSSVRRLVLNSEMRKAIGRGEFELHFQPKVHSSDHHIREAEALIRWYHPQHGDIPPGEFIPLAEKNGYIRQISLWVIEQTARQLAQWQQQGLTIRVSLNLSARNLQDQELVSYVIATTDSHGIAAEQLAFEVTETAVMSDPDYTRTLLLELNELGHHIAIDDYGTGYSSLAYIHRLPADELKIDSSFIFNMLESEDSALIVRSTIELAHNLGMRVTAEGVETILHAEILTNLGCDLLQGFYFSEPLAAEKFAELLQGGRADTVLRQD